MLAATSQRRNAFAQSIATAVRNISAQVLPYVFHGFALCRQSFNKGRAFTPKAMSKLLASAAMKKATATYYVRVVQVSLAMKVDTALESLVWHLAQRSRTRLKISILLRASRGSICYQRRYGTAGTMLWHGPITGQSLGPNSNPLLG